MQSKLYTETNKKNITLILTTYIGNLLTNWKTTNHTKKENKLKTDGTKQQPIALKYIIISI